MAGIKKVKSFNAEDTEDAEDAEENLIKAFPAFSTCSSLLCAFTLDVAALANCLEKKVESLRFSATSGKLVDIS